MINVIFLPGIIMPAALRYGPLLGHLADIDTHVMDLAVYKGDAPPTDYSIATEIAAIADVADRAGLERFHLCAHSGGGACALAFTAVHPERVLTLAIDEPATDFTPDDHADPYWRLIERARELPPAQAAIEFIRLQLAAGVDPPAALVGSPPPWMAKRPLGIRALSTALQRHTVHPDRYRAFRAPVVFTHGSLSHPRWAAMAVRLEALFPNFRSVLFEGLHHLNTSHQAEPKRTASLLRDLWSYA